MTHGGKRKSAGRPVTPGTMQSHTAQLTDELYDKAVKIGCGNLSRGIRIAVHAYTRKPVVCEPK
jgi:hypothetical protein